MSFLGGLITAVAPSIVGGLFGKKESSGSAGPNLVALVQQAKAAGFNPLTALQNGGTGPWMQQATNNDFDVGAMASAASGFINDYWSREQERELTDAQIDLTKAQTQSLESATPGQRAVQEMSPNAAYRGSVAVSRQARANTPPAMRTAQPAPTRGPSGVPNEPPASGVRLAETAIGGPGMGRDFTVYNRNDEPLEFETWGFGAAMDGQFPQAAQNVLDKNYPRVGKMVKGTADLAKGTFDNYERLYNEVPGQIEESLTPRLLTPDEQDQLANQSWLYRNLGFDIGLTPNP